MADYGQKVLGIYSASCEKLRQVCPVAKSGSVGDLVFFCDANKAKATHVGLIYKIDTNMIYTVEGNVPSGTGAVVATRSYVKSYNRIMSYGSPKYTKKQTAQEVIDVAITEVGYTGKQNNKNLNDKTGNTGLGNYTKYGKWMKANGTIWSGSFISWCFHVAFDSSSTEITGYGTAKDAGSSAPASIVTQTRFNSSLVTYVNRISSANGTPRDKQITRITVHIAKAVGDIYDLARLMNTSTTQSYNYGIDNFGVIGLFVDEILWTNSSNSTYNDMQAVNIVCMNSALAPDYTISDECFAALVKLCEDICRRNFIFELTYTLGPNDSLTVHSTFNPKSQCPGPYVTKKLKELAQIINRQLNYQSGTNYRQVSARLASSQTEALKIQSTIAIESIKPYVVQPHRSTLGIDYVALKRLGVVGTFIDAGERYNANHQIVQYRTDNVYLQTEEARVGGVPHAYFYTTHARNVAEVKQEADWFYFIITKYPPKLGVWLHCAFSVKAATAQALVDEWYKYFVKWGLKSKCGLYATRKQCKKIGWPKQCAYMPLWLEGDMTDAVCPDEEILTPSFFKLNDLSNQSAQSLSVTDLNSLNETEEIEETVFDSQNEFTYQIADPDLVDNSSVVSSSYQPAEASKFDLPEDDPKDGPPALSNINRAGRTANEYFTNISLPKTTIYSGLKPWTSYTSIRANNAESYDITHSSEAMTDSNGFRKVDDCFLIAVGGGVCRTIGTYVDLVLDNKVTISCIVGEIKPDSETDAVNHIFFGETNKYCCNEFIVQNRQDVLNPEIRSTGDCSVVQQEWSSPVISIKVYTSRNWFDKEE